MITGGQTFNMLDVTIDFFTRFTPANSLATKLGPQAWQELSDRGNSAAGLASNAYSVVSGWFN
jgi:hypothetical protein